MMVEVHLILKSNILSWSDQSWNSELSNGAKIKITIAYTDCADWYKAVYMLTVTEESEGTVS